MLETSIPFVPQEVLDRAESVRASLPTDIATRRSSADLFHDASTSICCATISGQTSSRSSIIPGNQQPLRREHDDPRIIARQTKNVRILSLGRSSRCGPIRCASRGICDRRCPVARPARDRLCQIRDSEMVWQCQPGAMSTRFWEGDGRHQLH